MTVRLRPHHLLCMLTYVGRGYSADFVAGFDRVVERLGQGEAFCVQAGPDDICAPMHGQSHSHCHDAGVTLRDARAEAALAGLLDAPACDGTRLLTAPLLDRLRAAFKKGDIRGACAHCPWDALCTGIATRDFEGTRLAMA